MCNNKHTHELKIQSDYIMYYYILYIIYYYYIIYYTDKHTKLEITKHSDPSLSIV